MTQHLSLSIVVSPKLTYCCRLGSIYFNKSSVAECSPAIVTNALQDIVDLVKSRYSIGPITRREFWEEERSKMQYHGPYE